ncbi:hypothetical protein [Escherichia phage dw-ec]|nr:hypothetical protein [Escherichia phage BI-EHEC]UJQ43734.1 hypothetical protein [Escherichia phage dw-ec]
MEEFSFDNLTYKDITVSGTGANKLFHDFLLSVSMR